VSAQRDNAATANLPQLQPLTAVAIIRETCSPRKESGRAEVEPPNGAAVIAACRPYILRLWRRCPPKTHPMDQLLDDRSTNERVRGTLSFEARSGDVELTGCAQCVLEDPTGGFASRRCAATLRVRQSTTLVCQSHCLRGAQRMFGAHAVMPRPRASAEHDGSCRSKRGVRVPGCSPRSRRE